MQGCRIIVDAPSAGPWNMAVDESLLRSASERPTPTLRFYAWSEPTLTLGYFQPLAERQQHPESLPCTCLRRSTGGGAIVHDQELTYSLTLPCPTTTLQTRHYYEQIHRAFQRVLADYGIAAHPAQGIIVATPEPFLCFARRSAADLVWQGHKILGSAQRRHGGAMLQHGSLLLCRSPYAPQLAGPWDNQGADAPASHPPQHAPPLSDLIEQICQTICGIFQWRSEPGELTPHEASEGERWMAERFACAAWTERR